MSLILDGTNGETFPSWTTATRPASPAVGQMGYNTTTGQFDAYTSTGWTTVANSGNAPVSGPAFSAYLNTTQATSSGVLTKVTCNTKEFDTASAYDNATNYRFTPLVAGYYQVTGEIQYAATVSTAVCTAILYKNGSQFKTGAQIHGSTTKAIGSIVSALVYFNGTTDYVELYAYQDTGFSQNLNGSAANVYFQACMLRSA